MVSFQDIESARRTISGHLKHTPLIHSSKLSNIIGAELYFKAENLQKTGSFKPRGALNKISSLTEEERERGIIAVSAGNHAQGVAWAASAAGVKATIVMASTASHSKIDATREYGAEVLLVDGGISAAFEQVGSIQEERGSILVHPFDDPKVIAGQGTVGMEILEDLPSVTTIVCEIGGGGLASGITIAAKSMKPDIRVFGVEPEGADVLRRSKAAGEVVEMKPETIADGLASPVAGELTLKLIERYLDDIVTVSDDAIIDALRKILIYTKLYVEPSGAAGLAALLTGAIEIGNDETVVAVLSGGNFDLEALREIL